MARSYTLRIREGLPFTKQFIIKDVQLEDWTGESQIRKGTSAAEVLIDFDVEVTVEGQDTIVTLGPLTRDETSNIPWKEAEWDVLLLSPDETSGFGFPEEPGLVEVTQSVTQQEESP